MLTNSWRPGHKYIDWSRGFAIGEDHIAKDNFLMNLENSCLADFGQGDNYPRGPERYKDKEWAAFMKKQVYPHHSDVDWTEYCEWVRQGGGDEWFIEDQ